MKIWLVTSGEIVPLKNERPNRIGILSKMLAKSGHKVIWWTTTFDHQKKEYLLNKNSDIKLDENLNIFYLHSKTPYYKNISLSRIQNHKEVAKSFELESRKKESPNIIFCSFPTIDLANSAVKFGMEFNVPVIIDVRDLWPDIFLNLFPQILKPFIKILLNTYFNQTKFIFKNCYGITGVSKKYLEFGLNYGKREKTQKDQIFPLGYDSEGKKQINIDVNDFKYLKINPQNINIWFVGTFGRTYDLLTVIKAAKKIQKVNSKINFVFTGDGENIKLWKKEANSVSNITFTGWLDKNELHYISLNSKIGLMAYSKGAPQGLPNKIFEYMTSSLPILSSLQSETMDLIESEKIGESYLPNNPEDLFNKIIKMTSDLNSLNEMSIRSRRVFEEKYDSNIIYKKLIKYLELNSTV